MVAELSQLQQLMMGQIPSLKMGDLPHQVAKEIGCHPGIIFLGANELRHIANKHKEMGREQFQQIPLLMKTASYYLRSERNNELTVFSRPEWEDKFYKLGLKSASGGSEVWIQTMFRITERKAVKAARKLRHLHGPRIDI